MEITGSLVAQSINDVLSMFGMNTTYEGEATFDRIESTSQINILIGITIGGGGNVVLGMDKPLAFHLASTMMCGMEVTALDDTSKSALSELTNMIFGNLLGKLLSSDIKIDISPPTLITGDKVLVLLSKIKAHRFLLSIGEHNFHITVAIHQ